MLNWLFPNIIPDWAQQVIFPVNRWLHVVCTTLLVGGTLFYEFVIPKAIEDLKEEAQLAVLGRVRWFFRQVVIFSALILTVTGCLSAYHQWPMFNGVFREVRLWLLLHIAVGLLALIVGIAAMARRRASRQPLIWLRVNFVILLVTIFVADVGRHMRMSIRDTNEKLHNPSSEPPPTP
jgi:uncharacterized membrane protein